MSDQRQIHEIRIKNIPAKVHQELLNIAENSGVPLTSIIKPKLAEIANSYPQKMREKPSKD